MVYGIKAIEFTCVVKQQRFCGHITLLLFEKGAVDSLRLY